MIENEIKSAIIREKNDQKFANQTEKEDLAQKNLLIKRKEEERAIAVRDILIICTAFCSSVLEACCC